MPCLRRKCLRQKLKKYYYPNALWLIKVFNQSVFGCSFQLQIGTFVNRDCRLSIPSVSIPYGQRFINIQLAAASSLLQHLHAFNPALDAPATYPVPVPDVTLAELWINNIFVNPEIHDIFIKRIGFSLIRVHRYQTIRTSKSADNLLLNQLKWPIETIYFGLRPTQNIDITSTSLLTDWDLYALQTPVSVDSSSAQDYPPITAAIAGTTVTAVQTALGTAPTYSAGGRALASIASITGAAGGTTISMTILNEWMGYYGFKLFVASDFAAPATPTTVEMNAHWPMPTNSIGGSGSGYNQLTYQTCTQTVDFVTIQAHGIPLYNTLPSRFFNSYTPYNYGGTHIQTPEDCGAYMIPFNLYPGSYQPSGHVNVSRAREFYLQFTSSVVGTSASPQADLVVVAIAINFLLISDGSAVLRYST